jgi:hypothetical protein
MPGVLTIVEPPVEELRLLVGGRRAGEVLGEGIPLVMEDGYYHLHEGMAVTGKLSAQEAEERLGVSCFGMSVDPSSNLVEVRNNLQQLLKSDGKSPKRQVIIRLRAGIEGSIRLRKQVSQLFADITPAQLSQVI